MANKIVYRTEDEVRDSAKIQLGFDKIEANVKQGTGQITTFNQLGFKGVIDKPDGWYLPDDCSIPAIILETKSEAEDISLQKWADELIKNCDIVSKKYKNTCGILYNGIDIRVFKNGTEVCNTEISNVLQNKSYYLALFTQDNIDKQQIYNLTKRINDCLHTEFGIKNLYHRMIFTACALVAKRYGALLIEDMSFTLMKNSILSTLSKSLEESRKQNLKLDLLTEVYSEIKMNNTTNQDAINNFIDWVSEISDCVNSDHWNGEDVMGIFFNEFNRYKKKSESGQVFTPDHITSFMYRLIEVNQNDKVLDAACGSGAFLVKSMCNMMKEAGGINTEKGRQDIKDRWQSIEDKWVDIIRKQSGDDTVQWIKPSEHLSYQMPEKPFEIFEEDFTKTMMDYLMFKQGIDVKEFSDSLVKKVMYDSKISSKESDITIVLKGKEVHNETN